MLHKVVYIPVVFHVEDDEVCPVSLGSSCPHLAPDSDTTAFEDPTTWEKVKDDLTNLRKLTKQAEAIAGRIGSLPPNGLRLPPGYSWSEVTGQVEADSVASTAQADSGLGDSLPDGHASQHGFQNALLDAFARGLSIEDEDPMEGHHGDELDLDSAARILEDGEEGDDTVKPLPRRSEYKRYAKKKKIALQVLNTVTPQQIATLSPTLKDSMDNFINQLELHAGVRIVS